MNPVRPLLSRRRLLSGGLTLLAAAAGGPPASHGSPAGGQGGTAAPSPAPSAPLPPPRLPREKDLPRFRVATDGWGRARPEEVDAVLRSAAAVLWPLFPGLRREPFVVVRGREGPIVHYQRNVMGEIVMKLDTQDYLWCQFVYQFSHEFCHILCGFDDDAWRRNNWFEETLCEAASLYVLRRLTAEWEDRPPWPSWRAYAPEFRRYAQGVMDSRSQVGAGHLHDFYRRHRRTLENSPRERALNGAMALPLLQLLEASPSSWEAAAWLNATPSPEGESFPGYLEKWRQTVPPRHRRFVAEIIRQFGAGADPVERAAAPPGAAGPPGPRQSAD